MRRSLLRRMLPVVMGRGGAWEANVVCPAITPTLGAEYIDNGNMETGDPPTGWNATNGGVLASVADERTGGAGSKSMSITNTTVTYGSANQLTGNDPGTWVKISMWGKKVTGAFAYNIFKSTSPYTTYSRVTSTSTSWLNIIRTLYLPEATFMVTEMSDSVGTEARFDDISVMPITFASMTTLLGARAQKNGAYSCHPTVSTGTQCGLLIEYKDVNNFLMVITDRFSAYLISYIAGVRTVARTGAITYVAAAELRTVVNGTVHQLYYNGTQVGADVVIDNRGMGLGVYGFNSLAGNTVGLVTTNP